MKVDVLKDGMFSGVGLLLENESSIKTRRKI